MSFLVQHPSLWDKNEDFKKGLDFVMLLHVTNNAAERGVKLIENYNKTLTKNEEQKQYVLQVISNHQQ